MLIVGSAATCYKSPRTFFDLAVLHLELGLESDPQAETRSAYYLYWAGRTDEERKHFSGLLAQESAVQHSWFRSLILELRKTVR